MKHNPKIVADFFSNSLESFLASRDTFRILCTLPHGGPVLAPRAPVRPVKQLIVLDSSFNPPTKAHAQMAQSAILNANTEIANTRLLLLLAVNNADKAPTPASFPSRLNMMDGFGRGLLEQFGPHGLEIDVAVTTMPYFHTKSNLISQSFAQQISTEQVFLTGFDTVIRVFNPKYYGDGYATVSTSTGMTPMQVALGPLFNRARLRVTMRPDDGWGSAEDQHEYIGRLGRGELDHLGVDKDWISRIELVDGANGAGISSSKVREAVLNGNAAVVDYSVDAEVREWIGLEGLYRQ